MENSPPLHAACKIGDLSAVQDLLKHGADVSEKDISRGWTPLHYASTYGHLRVAELLVENSAEVNATDKNGMLPLAQAFRKGRISIRDINIHRGANVGMNTKWERPPGSRDAYLCIALLLINRGSDLDWIKDIGSDVSDTSYCGMTPLQLACNSGYVSIAKLIIARGGDVNLAGRNGNTPLQQALGRNHTDCIQVVRTITISKLDYWHVNEHSWQIILPTF
jgi:ankyrin repeat protein